MLKKILAFLSFFKPIKKDLQNAKRQDTFEKECIKKVEDFFDKEKYIISIVSYISQSTAEIYTYILFRNKNEKNNLFEITFSSQKKLEYNIFAKDLDENIKIKLDDFLKNYSKKEAVI